MTENGSGRQKASKHFKGIPVSAGTVAARICLFSIGRQKLIPEYSLENDEAVSQELRRFGAARIQCAEELTRIAANVEVSIGKAEAEIFITQQHILNDPKVIDAIAMLITAQHKNTEWAINKVLLGFEDRMASLDNQYLRERSGDISELRRRLLNRLTNSQAGFICKGQYHCRQGVDSIIVAEELTTEMIVNMRMDRVLGLVTEHGGVTSHAAILARSLGIPAVSGISGIMQHVGCGDIVLINGDTGEVHLHPDGSAVQALSQGTEYREEREGIVATPKGMELSANASTLEDVKLARLLHADGIGLFRTEILFVGAERLLSEDEQHVFYRDVADIMDGSPVTFRMLDVGGTSRCRFYGSRRRPTRFWGFAARDSFSVTMRSLTRRSGLWAVSP